MPNMSGTGVGFALLTASLLALGCGGITGVRYPLPDAPKSTDFRRVVLLPMNFDYAPSPQLAAGVEVVSERLRSFLRAQGYEVVEPLMSSTLAVWKKCTEEFGGLSGDSGKSLDEESYEKARSELARRAIESLSADGLVASTVLVRKGRYYGEDLSWDGVSRPVPIDADRSTRAFFALRGSSSGTSLRTSVFDRTGRLIFERFVGLEPIHGYQIVGDRFEPVVRTDLFQDEEIIQGGIALSFDPWLVRPSVE